MKLVFALVLASLAVLTAKKQNLIYVYSEEDETYSDEGAQGSSALDLKGTLKRSFAAEAMTLNLRGNVICSPLSALLPLGKLILGTVPSKSREEMLRAIGTRKAMIKRKFKELFRKLKYLPGVTLSIASRLFISRSFEVSPRYEEDTITVFHSSLDKLNFKNSQSSANTINNWVNTQTKGKIKGMVSPSEITADTKMILVNAIYFAGQWANPFDYVFVGDFHSALGKRRIPMMTRKQKFNYVRSRVLNAQIVEIPYEGNKASFILVLPQSRTGLSMLLSELKLAPELLNLEMERMESTKLTLTMPKFKIQTELDLKNLYGKIGVKSVFEEDSGLLRISREPVYLSKAVQKAYIEVSEKGTEAAAASSVVLQKLNLIRNEFVIANHPFLFFVLINREQIFAGSFNNPEETQQNFKHYSIV